MMKKLLFSLLLLTSTLCSAQWAQIVGNITATGANTCVTAGSCVILQLPPGAATATIVVSGTYSATLQFEQTADERSTFTSATATPQPPAGSTATSTTSTGTWVVSVSGMSHIQVRASSYSSGTAQVTLNASPGASGGNTLTPVAPLPSDPSTVIGQVSIVNTAGSTDPCQNPSVLKSSTPIAITSATTTALVAVSGTTKVYVCGYDLTISQVVTTANTILFEQGTGAACAGSPTSLTGAFGTGGVTAGIPIHVQSAGNGTIFSTAAANGLCAVTTIGASGAFEGIITFVQQ